MNENLLKVVDALINDDETMASEYLRQELVNKVRVRIGINESLQTELEQTLNQDEQQKLFKKFQNYENIYSRLNFSPIGMRIQRLGWL
jgi:hypothetical protein